MVLAELLIIYDSILDDAVREETFSDAVVRLARERNLSAPQVYRSAGIDYRHYSKIISDRNYQPKKDTAIALAIAFRLSVEETEELLAKAGYSFSPSSKADRILKSFIESGEYDRKRIDKVMATFGLPLLPGKWT